MPVPVFTTGEVLTSNAMNSLGLWLVKTQSFTTSTGVEVSNCFSSDYENYKVLITYYGSVATNSQLQYMTGTNTKDQLATYDRWGFYWNAGINAFNQVNNTSMFVVNHFTADKNFSTAEFTIFRPFVSNVNTVASLHSWSGDSGLATWLDHSKVSNSSFTGLYFFPASGNVTGTIRVYGYRN